MQVDRKLGFTLLAVYLIIQGLSQAASLSFQYQHLVLGGLAIASGAVLFLKR
jgi:hypothetical protein